jgi:hypothetical protein
MFNLEQAISEWRRQMLAAGIKTPVPLEELELHLREEIERQIQSGASKQQAFAMAQAVGSLFSAWKVKNVLKKRSSGAKAMFTVNDGKYSLKSA